ncbi:MAG: hypothetical protein WBG32_16630 [Nodosilinea sp.]
MRLALTNVSAGLVANSMDLNGVAIAASVELTAFGAIAVVPPVAPTHPPNNPKQAREIAPEIIPEFSPKALSQVW